MSIGLVDDNQFEDELRRLRGENGEIVGEINPLPNKGRAQGDNNIPDPLRQIIGEEAVINGRQSALLLAKDFGISPSSVSAYAKGATSTASYSSPSKSIISHINKSRQRAIKKAQVTLHGALNAITQEKLDYTEPKDLAAIAKDMTVIIKNLEPPQQSASENDTPTPQFVIYAPTFKDERSFESITVKE